MEDVDFSDEFCRFLQANVPTVEAAELLLLLYRSPEPVMSEPTSAKFLQMFQSTGLAAAEGHAVRYRPATAQLDAHVRTLAQAYEERPVTLIRIIYALRDGKIRSFADAFKLRKG